MFKVSWKADNQEKQESFPELSYALNYAKTLNCFVTITDLNNTFELVGKFGVDTIKDNTCPDGIEYSWKKRRT